MVRSPFEPIPERPVLGQGLDTGRGLRPTDLQWQDLAQCREADPELFFHPEGERTYARRRRVEAARKFCGVCAVLETCRVYALKNNESFGIWGGLSEDERRTLTRRRNRFNTHQDSV